MATIEINNKINTRVFNQIISSSLFTNENPLNQESNNKVLKILDYDVQQGSLATQPKIETTNLDEIDITINIPIDTAFKKNDSFSLIQSWIGYVISIDEKTFLARIEEVMPKHSGTYEEAVFDLNEIEEEDKRLLQVGNSFYWNIGFENRKGTRSKQSIIRFRRIPRINPSEFDNIVDRSRKLASDLKWE